MGNHQPEKAATGQSATATALARPLNLSTMTDTSMVCSWPPRTHSQPGRPSVASVVAQLRAFNLVSTTHGDWNSVGKPLLSCDLKVAEWMASSSSLFIGIDESTKSTKRSFVEIEIGGQLCSMDPDLHIWCVPLTMKELVSHSTEKMLELILDEFQQMRCSMIKASTKSIRP